MTIDLVFKNHTSFKAPAESFFARIITVGLKITKPKDGKVEIGINLVGEERIKKLNATHRGKNKVTDVLSFPLENLHSGKSLDGQVGLKNYGILSLGDIFICLPFARKEAIIDKMTLQAKLAQLTVHGFLHLLGYDHEISVKGAKAMLGLENKILKQLNI